MLRLDGTVKEVDDAETGFFLNENVAKTFFRRSSPKNEVLIDSGIRKLCTMERYDSRLLKNE